MFSASVFFFLCVGISEKIESLWKIKSGLRNNHKPVDESSLVLVRCYFLHCLSFWGTYGHGSCDMNDEAQTPFLFFQVMQLLYLFMIQKGKKIR